MNVRCYGGPLHGKMNHVEDGCRRMQCYDNRFTNTRVRWDLDPTILPMDSFRTVSYEIGLWSEQRGNAYRDQKIAILEGAKNLLPEEQYQIDRDMNKLPWKPRRKVSILKEFDRWFNWCVYRHTGEERRLHEEFHQL